MAVWPIIYVFGTALSIVVADTTADQEKSPEKLCVMPPYPAHGTYLSYVGASPGDKGVAAHFGVFCDKGYVLVGEKELTCLSGMWSDDMPECVPVCKAGKKSGVVQCTAESAQCVITPELLPTLGHRTASGKYSCGSVSITDHVIAGGTNAHFFDSPWHAGLYTKTTKPYMQICGAAHCFSRDGSTPPAYKYAVAVGKIYRPWNEEHDKKAQKADVKEIRIPPRYFGSTGNFQDDIALVIVDKEFDYTDAVTPACLSFDRQLDEEQLQDGNLGKASVNLIDHTKCKLLLHAGSMRRWYFPGRAGPFVLKPKLANSVALPHIVSFLHRATK